MDGMQNDLSQKIDNLQYSISRLTNLNTVQEKGRFPSQPHQNPKGIHEVETHEGESSQVRDVKALITLRSVNANPEKELIKEELMKKRTSPPFPQALHGKKGIKNASEILEVLRQVKVNIPLLDMIKQVPTYAKFLKDLCTIKRGLNVNKKAFLTDKNGLMQLTFGNMTLELNIFHMSKKLITPEEEEGPEEVCIIDTLVEEHCNQNMQDELNESLEDLEEGLSEPADVLATLQGWRRKEEILPLFNKEEGQDDEISLLEVLKRCKKAIGWQISDLKGISPLPLGESYSSGTKEVRITVVQNEKGRNCYTPHFRLEVLERVSGHPFYCFLDGYSGYFQIEIDVEDQEKTTFTCPFGTYAYRRMPFGLCNAPATFQRCMLSIFSDMVERIMEVFMDDITIYGGTFEECLVNLEAVLKRCIEKDLVLNWEKCHFMVHQGIVLGHIISEKGIEVDKAKVELIAKLPSPTTVKGVRQFLGHAGAPNWQLPFEVMCDASDFAIGAVLGQREDGKPYVIYYASKTLNEAQRNYTTTEKELDKKGVENVVADHLSRLAIAHNSHVLPINDDFPEESLMLLEKAPWYSHIANYLVTGEVPREWKAQDRKHFFAKIHAYYWEEPFLFKHCADQIIRKCVPEEEKQGILSHCHENACGGHFAS
ncbi:Retrovirus-related Pol polyprotein from transposon 17.6 [Vitis vinifera]|uniref:Retrovirus-related Pol polyprotein from transposon 17.6 n=1 Tax=Vitis vinifera TaxID=29760 RepID=A0A438FSQ6_VITVI|nr:Retrovirus-related Pol polyprotein from transposon 17.6 [Vitis vinifera]